MLVIANINNPKFMDRITKAIRSWLVMLKAKSKEYAATFHTTYVMDYVRRLAVVEQ